MKKTHLYLGIISFALLAACKKEVNSSPGIQQQSNASDKVMQKGGQNENYAENEVLIKFKKGIPEQIKNNILASVTGTISKKVVTHAMAHAGDKDGFLVVHTPLKVLDAISKIKSQPGIEYAEPNFKCNHPPVINDPEYVNGNLWGMYGDKTTPANKYGSQAGEAWAKGHTGKNTIFVGVIDEGAMYNHTDLAGNIQNPVEYKGLPGVDDDGNGYIDDVYGWDFYYHDNTTFDGLDDDHGTHVSGTIGAKGGNKKGVAGVCWKIRMITAKFLGPFGGYISDGVEAIDYITDLKTRDGYNIVATNNSWITSGYSQSLYDAISRANDENILFVAAAGNYAQNIEDIPIYPAGFDLPNIISVAAITSTGDLAGFSNYGSKSVDLGAPGQAIISTLPAWSGSHYGYYSGTSMATPHVTGAVALYASTHPGATAAQIKAAILTSTIKTPSLKGKTATGGRLNLSNF